MTNLNKIAVVILNWNGVSFLKDFLPKVIQFSGNARIIVADNNSSDDSVSFVKSNFPQVEIIINEENGGFAKGYNDALKHVDSPYYLLLNSDIEVTENWLVPLLAKLESDQSIAGCQPKIKSFARPEMFEHAGASGGFIDKNYFPFCRGRIFTTEETDIGQYNSEKEVFWVSGAAFLLRSELFHESGGFDEMFFAHMEEIDLCWRIKRRGFTFYVVPESVVYHVGGGTLAYNSPRKTFLNFRNSLFMIIKNHDGILFFKLFNRLSLDGVAGVRFLLRGEFKNFYMVLKSHVEMYWNLPKLYKTRRALKKLDNSPNLKGLYNGSILWAHFFKGVTKFSELNQRLFK